MLHSSINIIFTGFLIKDVSTGNECPGELNAGQPKKEAMCHSQLPMLQLRHAGK
jgi:hypothetical protein